MRVVVTGASGNVGTAVLRRFAARSEPPEIVAIARRVPPARDPYSVATWCRLDLSDPGATEALRAVMQDADAVVHLAWGFQPSHRRGYLGRVGVDGTRAVYTAAAEAGVAHVVHMSSAAVYDAGSYGRPVDENWPTAGISTCVYSMDKVRAEHILDELSGDANAPVLTRFRPGFIGQYVAGSGLARYVLPDWLPGSTVDHVPVLPMDRSLVIPAVHADDVAAAVESALDLRAPGLFNLASPVPVRAEDFADPFGCRTVPIPWRALSAAVDAAWRLRIQPVQGGWIDLAYNTPMLDCGRASANLGWSARRSGPHVWAETVEGMRAGAGTDSPVLRMRSFREKFATVVERGTVGRRIPS